MCSIVFFFLFLDFDILCVTLWFCTFVPLDKYHRLCDVGVQLDDKICPAEGSFSLTTPAGEEQN